MDNRSITRGAISVASDAHTDSRMQQQGADVHAAYSSSSLHLSDPLDPTNLPSDAFQTSEMDIHEQLSDIESSFLPDPASEKTSDSAKGLDDTYLNLGSRALVDQENISPAQPGQEHESHNPRNAPYESLRSTHIQSSGDEHASPADAEHLDSPSIAASIRNEKRAAAGFQRQGTDPPVPPRNPSRRNSQMSITKGTDQDRPPTSMSRSPEEFDESETLAVPDAHTAHTIASSPGSPTKSSHQSHSRQVSSSNSLAALSDYTTDSENTIGADYALQTGVAAPNDSPTSTRYIRDLSRLPSFGSVVSETSGDGDRRRPTLARNFSAVASANGLNRTTTIEEDTAEDPPETPRANTSHMPAGVTETVIAQHVQNIRVPDTIALDFRQRFRPGSPEKRSTSVSAQSKPQSTLTLKEQNSKIDKLTKENFDLKLKIHFLDQALQNRSDEGIKDMINANVTFQTDLAKERRDNQALRRRIRDLEKLLGDAEDNLADAKEAHEEAQINRREEIEIEISELREQLDHAQVRITKLSAENLAKEMERQRMNEHVMAMQERKTSAVGDEEVDMWRDLLTEEQGRREMAEEDARKLREENAKLKTERMKRERERSRSIISRTNDERSGSTITLVEQLRHENNELKRDLGAQSSMLTSRNKERERLQQEIEDLKILHRKGGDADSIFERSASRAAKHSSRISGLGFASHMDDHERDEYERREGLLRDENAQLRLQYQDLGKEAEARMDYISQLEEDLKSAELDLATAVEDVRALQTERDEALQVLEDREGEIGRLNEDYRRLEEEAVLNIEGLEDNMAQHRSTKERIAGELQQRNQDFAVLQAELRSVAAKLMHFEGDRDASLKRIEVLERELDDATQELETLERKLRESEQKNQRLEVQSESLQNEISFLREEQEADKVKIGDLTNTLSAAQQAVRDEKEKMSELESSLFEERRQRELIDDQSKQEVQKVIADLNADNARTRDDLRRMRRGMSTKENEAETYKARLEELETNLRRALGEVAGTRTTLLQDVEKLQHDLSRTIQDLDTARADVADKERLIRSRDALLESSGLEASRLSDLLDKERQGRKHDLHNFELAQRGNSTNLRTIANHETRTGELETALAQAKRRAAHAESTYKEQLAERNALLLSLWNKLSALCGPGWIMAHGTLNGAAPSLDNMGRFWTQFQRNIESATKHIEGLFSTLRTKIRTVEKQMTKDISVLNHHLNDRVKHIERVERSVAEVTEVNQHLRSAIANANISTSSGPMRSPSVMSVTSIGGGNKLTKVHQEELNRLRAEIKSLKGELKRTQSEDTPSSKRRSSVLGLVRGDSSASRSTATTETGGTARLSPASLASKLLRQNSDGAVRTLSFGPKESGPAPAAPGANDDASTATQEQDEVWLHRVRELERRLKAEREARLLDRKGARERLEARQEENDALRGELEREKKRAEGRAEEKERSPVLRHTGRLSPAPTPGAVDEAKPKPPPEMDKGKKKKLDAKG